MIITRFGLVAIVLLTAPSVFAHSDVLVRSDGTQVLIGAAGDLDMEEGGPFFDLETDTFEAVFINPAVPTPPFAYDFERDEPGFYNDPTVPVGQNLPAGADIALSLTNFSTPSGTDKAFYWDGTGEVDFQPLSAAQPGVSFTFAPMSPSPFATTAGDGFVDDHPLFGLTGGAADGVYWIEPVVSVDGLLDSEPFSMVWLADALLVDEDTAESLEEALEEFEGGGPEPMVGGKNFAFFEEAVEYVESVPEPSTALLAMIALAALRARRS